MNSLLVSAASPPYRGLKLSFSDMDKEIHNMRLLSRPFLKVESYERVLVNWRNQLSGLKARNLGQSLRWIIPEDDPIETVVSDGEYEAGKRRGRLKVFGRVSSTWDIHLAVEGVKKKGSPSRTFILLGLASTKITVWADDSPDKEIARWTIEVGDVTSPGCHFHTQIDLDERDNKFPKALSVPRLPGLLHTPMDGLEFLLSELFQDKWHQRASEGRDYVKAWANCQRARIVNLLEWQRDKLIETSGSPWTMLKKQKPELDMLCQEK